MSITPPNEKIMSLEQAKTWEQSLHKQGQKLVVTNGVFDLLHRGHAFYLNQAAAYGDKLLIAINSDEAVHQLKGPSRPIMKEDDRAFMLASLECVAAVVIFDATKPVEVFKALDIDVYVKGGDYTEDTLDREEHAILKAQNVEFVFIPFVKGFSTTNTIKHIRHEEGQASDQPADSELDPRLNFAFTRRSVRKFQPRPIGDDLMVKLIEAAMAAPTASGKDACHFVVLKDQKLRSQIADCLPSGRFLADAPNGLVVCGNLHQTHGEELSYMLQNCAAATENILLAANALSLGACWLGIHPRMERVKSIQNFLGLPENVIPVAGIAIGYPAEEHPARTRSAEERIHWNNF